MTNSPTQHQIPALNDFPWAQQEGWGALDEKAQQAAATEEQYESALKQYETCCMVRDVMTQGRGPEFLEYLRTITVEQPAFVAGVQMVDQGNYALLPAEQQGFVREGQNSLYWHLKNAIKAAEAGPPQRPELPTEGVPENG